MHIQGRCMPLHIEWAIIDKKINEIELLLCCYNAELVKILNSKVQNEGLRAKLHYFRQINPMWLKNATVGGGLNFLIFTG